MQDEIFNLPDGSQVLMRLHEGSVYVYFNGQPLFGPIEVSITRKSLNIPLPDREMAYAKLGYDDRFAVVYQGQRLLRPGEKPPKKERVTGDATIRSAANSLFLLAGFGYAMVALGYYLVQWMLSNPEIAEQIGQELEVPLWAWIVSATPPTLLLLLGLWARRDDRKAGVPLAIGGSIYLVNFLLTLAQGNRFGALVAAAIMTKLFTAALAASAVRGAHITKQEQKGYA